MQIESFDLRRRPESNECSLAEAGIGMVRLRFGAGVTKIGTIYSVPNDKIGLITIQAFRFHKIWNYQILFFPKHKFC
jgi:hypothetical protein